MNDILEYYKNKFYTLTWNKPDKLIFPKGAWIIRDWNGTYIEDFQRKSTAEKRLAKYNDSLQRN